MMNQYLPHVLDGKDKYSMEKLQREMLLNLTCLEEVMNMGKEQVSDARAREEFGLDV